MTKEPFKHQMYRLYQAHGGKAGPDSVEFADWAMAKMRHRLMDRQERYSANDFGFRDPGGRR